MSDMQVTRLNRKYQVFISSTFSDLKDHRTAAILGIVKARHMPIALENYPPDGEAKIKVIHEAIAECQFYVIILGCRYGTVPAGQKAGEEKSYVEIELDYAQRQGLKVLAFVMDMNLARDLPAILSTEVTRFADDREKPYVYTGLPWN